MPERDSEGARAVQGEGGGGALPRARLDRESGELRRRYWRNHQAAAIGKTVLLVEGDDDGSVVEEIFSRRKPTWETKAHVAAAGGRNEVLARMKPAPPTETATKEIWFPNAYGLVDRDTWSDDEVAERIRTEQRLVVTEGWCLENLFFDPAWLNRYDTRVAELVAMERERWVRAGALWWTLQRAREAQQRWQDAIEWTYGAVRDDLDLSSPSRLADSLAQIVPEQVRRDARLDISAVADAFKLRIEQVLDLPVEVQWKVGVHGKVAFRLLLVPALNRFCDQRSTDAWLSELAGKLERPPPFDRLLAMLFP